MQTIQSGIFPEIKDIFKVFNLKNIEAERQEILIPLIDFIQAKVNNQQEIRLNLICTHNSRRSHLAQILAQTAATHFNIQNVLCYSGGTEVTAMSPMIASTLQDHGFKINKLSDGTNPLYSIKYAPNKHPVIGFSKIYLDSFNPESEFAAIMTCSQADGGCPFIPGAEKRIPITYEDPKVFDNSPQQAEKYKELSLQIANEMLYVFSQIKNFDVSK